ncbi:MAG: non-canonical purine NTP pyrophosphatase, RdgB/HAM1 family [Legionellales bacterium]|nr:non-canonical purine NTP pyrophosphatase, RdgB/HAM1 family [Legionellales bacterium]
MPNFYRQFSESKLIIASHNQGKVREIGDLLRPYNVETLSAASLGLEEPEETGKTFKANAELKARLASTVAKLPALADDSGLVVPALQGDPGIYSARWAGPEKDFDKAMQLVESRLKNSKNRDAYFVAALALCWPDGHSEIFTGRVYGSLVWPKRGSLGFGYDPIFLPTGSQQTFGEMEPALKHSKSHRSKAFTKLTKACFGT